MLNKSQERERIRKYRENRTAEKIELDKTKDRDRKKTYPRKEHDMLKKNTDNQEEVKKRERERIRNYRRERSEDKVLLDSCFSFLDIYQRNL